MPDWLTKDFHWKAFSLLMAVGIWLTVSRPSGTAAAQGLTRLQQPYVSVPVVPVSADTTVRGAQIYPPTVTVTIAGGREVMGRLQPSQIHAFVNLTGLTSAQNLARDVEVSLPPETTVVDVDPPQVTVTLGK